MALAWAAAATLLCAHPVLALDPARRLDEYCLRYWSQEDGLPHNSVWALLQTRDGFLWLGTQAGLARYDGTRFTVFDDTSEPAFRENAVHALSEGRDGSLVVAPIRDELLRRDAGGVARLAGSMPPAWRGHGVGDVLAAGDGKLYVTANGGLARIRPGQPLELIAQAEMPADLSLVRRRILEDSGGRIFWAAPDGVWTLDRGRPRRHAAIAGAAALVTGPDGSLWVGTDAGRVFRLRNGRSERIDLGGDLGGYRTTALLLDREGSLWVGTRDGLYRRRHAERGGGGLERLEAVAGVQDLALDSRGSLWIATRAGLFCLRDVALRSYSPLAEAREIVSLAEDGEGGLWFVSREAPQLWRLQRGQARPVRGAELPVRALALHRDETGTLWLGTEKGLYRRAEGRFRPVPGSPQVPVIAIQGDRDGALWFADERGVLRRRLADGSYLAFGRESGLSGRQVSSLCRSRDGSLWVATYDGVYRVVDGRFQPVPLGTRAGHRFARQVAEDAEGRIWIGTRAGLVRFEGGVTTTFGRREGLPDTVINVVVDDGRGNLWLGCPSGLFRVAKSQLAAPGPEPRLRIDHMLYGHCDRDAFFWSRMSCAVRAEDGTIWFGTARGLVALPSDGLARPGPPPTPQIEEVVVDEARQPSGAGQLELPAGSRHLAIRFTAPSLEAPELTAFRYRLVGYDKRWVEGSSERVAHYVGLPPGRYTFRVAAATAGVWGRSEARLQLTLAPLWHQRPWVRALPWILVGALPLLVYLWRLRWHRGRERQLEQRVRDRTLALREEVRVRTQAEQALRASEERYALAVRGNNDGIWDWDLATGKVYYSPAFEAILGYAEGELGDRPEEWLLRIHPEDVDAVQIKLVAVQQSQQAQLVDEHRIRHKDGRLRWTLLRASVVRSEQGEVARLVGTLSDVTERRAYDALTGLPNRLYLVERVRDALNRSRRQSDRSFAVLAIDVDRFDLLTNSLGYQGSDRLLAGVARRLESSLRPSDVVGRFEGDDFVAILGDVADVREAQAVATRLQQAIAAPFDLDGKEIYTSVSVGIAPGLAAYDDPEDLVRDAHTALGRAKAWGRARCGVFDERMRLQSTTRLQLEGELRRSCERGELSVHYQPVVTPANGRIAGFEALVRWRHPTRGLLHPDDFIIAAEETGTVVPIGYWVLAEACRQARRWSERLAGANPPFVSVNISARQFAEPDFVDRVQRILRETDCPPGVLHLEITETTLLQADRDVLETLGRLRQLQLHLAVDDFGTGYSSLGYLQRFPIDLLKIDRSFVMGMGPHGERSAIVRMIVALARDIDVVAVAEGVETQAQRDLLVALGCQLAQGHFFAQPLEPEAADRLLERVPPASGLGGAAPQASLFN